MGEHTVTPVVDAIKEESYRMIGVKIGVKGNELKQKY